MSSTSSSLKTLCGEEGDSSSFKPFCCEFVPVFSPCLLTSPPSLPPPSAPPPAPSSCPPPPPVAPCCLAFGERLEPHSSSVCSRSLCWFRLVFCCVQCSVLLCLDCTWCNIHLERCNIHLVQHSSAVLVQFGFWFSLDGSYQCRIHLAYAPDRYAGERGSEGASV